jgi:toxin CptA
LSARFDSPIVLPLGPSRRLAGLFVTSHIGGALLVATLPLTLAWQALLLTALAVSGANALARHAWRRCRQSVVEVALDADGLHTLRFRAEATELPFTITARFLHPRLALIAARCPACRGTLRIVIPADAVEAERFRRWRARVRLQSAEG